ncbi:MAG: hypothetical protein ACP5OA_07555 [Candidatus Woesearchaeota archaeon]
MTSPYDAGASRRYASKRKAEEERRRYIARETQKLNFEYGQENVNPYDLRQVARIREMFQKSREIYKR